ncbi:hypothetical protein [Enterococcus sp. DIV1758]|uniref:hypothetical protein n=1 Tax=Enterococcus sp. DIV1758 TaxID=2774744 RepID=UPI003F26AE07
MKKMNKVLTLMMVTGTLSVAMFLSSTTDAAEIKPFSSEWGDSNGKFPDEGPIILKKYNSLIFSNKKLSNLSATLLSNGTYSGTNTLSGSIIAEGEFGNLTSYSYLVKGYIVGKKVDGSTQKWELTKMSEASLMADSNSLVNNTKLSFGVYNEAIPTSQFIEFSVVMNVKYGYYLSGWDYMMGSNQQHKVITYSFGF